MYCNKCGYKLDNADEFCRKCGNAVSSPAKDDQPPVQQQDDQTPVQASGYEATVQQSPVYQAPMQQASGYRTPAVTSRDFWGRFGGIIVYGSLILLVLIIGAATSSGHFLSSINSGTIVRRIVMLLPIGFAVGLTVKHKGVDLSIPAMVSLSFAICCMTDNFAMGILLSFVVCILIGAINAVCIHYLKLPGMLVTLPMYLILSIVVKFLVYEKINVMLDAGLGFLYVVALISVIVAVGIALISSIGKDSRNKFITTLVVYAGSGVFAVLYTIGLSVIIKSLGVYDTSWMITTILLVAIFLSLSRFFKSKLLSIVFAIIPVIFSVLIQNVMCLLGFFPSLQDITLLLITLILLLVLFYRGRAQLIGQSVEKQYRAKSWIAFIPLLFILLKSVIMCIALLIDSNNSLFLIRLSNIFPYVALLVAVGACIGYSCVKPREQLN